MPDLSSQIIQNRQAWFDLLSQLQSGGASPEISDIRYNIINLVKVKIDELMPEGEGVQFELENTVNHTETLTLYINAIMDNCANILHQTAPTHVVNGKNATVTPVINSDYSGYIILPDDFIRLKLFKLTQFERPIIKLITQDSPEYIKQLNRFTRGGKSKPIGVLNWKEVDVIENTQHVLRVKKVIDYYSLTEDDETHDLESFIYIPTVLVENVQTNLVDALTWIIAAEVLQITKRSDEAKIAWDQVDLCYKNL